MRARSAHVPAGWYLISVEREIVDNDWGQLGTTLDRLLASAGAQPRQATQSNHDATVGAM